MNKIPSRYLVVAALALLLPTAHATIIGGSVTGGTALTAGGTFVKIAPGFTQSTPDNTVGNDTFQSPNLWGFDEDQNVLVGPGNLSVDLIAGGGSGTILAGTEVASHYVFFDPVNHSQTGYVDFDAKILAVISSTANLLASDYLANTGVTYLNPGLRGLEAGDFATISATDDFRLLVDWTASSPGDYVRVLTEHSPRAVPEAGSTVALFGAALLALGAVRRARR